MPEVLNDPLGQVLPFGSVSFLAGASGTGKTALIASLLKALRDGQPVFGHPPGRIASIGVVTADRPWLHGSGAWFDRVGYSDVLHYSMLDDPSFDPRSLRRRHERTLRLVEFIDKLKLAPYSLVLVDPVGLFLGGNLNDYDTCAVGCCELRAALRIRSLTLIATAHTGKMKTDRQARFLRPQDAILGSAALYGFGDTQMYLATPEELRKPYYAFLWHPHMAPPETFPLVRDEKGLFVPYGGADQQMKSPSAHSESVDAVLCLFPTDGTPLTGSALVELAETLLSMSRATVFRVLQQLVEEGLVEKVGRGTYKLVL